MQKAHPEVPWKDIIGMRHKIIHDYFDVRIDIIWGSAETDLPVLAGQIQKILETL